MIERCAQQKPKPQNIGGKALWEALRHVSQKTKMDAPEPGDNRCAKSVRLKRKEQLQKKHKSQRKNDNERIHRFLVR